MEKRLPAGVSAVLKRLEEAGYEGYLVGGCVRDRYMGKEPNDYDITTSALPQELLPLFERVLQTGIAHGTVTVLTADGPVEVTTYRQDGKYSDHRHPDGVEFTRSLSEDLARRDFTINALALDGAGNIVDLFGGRADIQNKILRCVGDPDRRFEEDALRILRGLRFAARLGFEIEAQTAAAMERKKALLKEIAAERIFAELCGLLQGAYAADVLKKHRSIIEVFLPEMGEAAKPLCPPAFGIATLLKETKDPAQALGRLKAPNAFKAEVLMLIRNQAVPLPADERGLHRLCADLGAKNTQTLFAYRGWDGAPLQAFLQKAPCLSMKDLALDGRDLMALGLQGAAIGKAQEYLLQAVIAGLPNEKETLLNAIKNR